MKWIISAGITFVCFFSMASAYAATPEELRVQLLGPQGVLTSQVIKGIEHNVKIGTRPFFSLSEVEVMIDGQPSSDPQIKRQIRDSFLAALTSQGQSQREGQAQGDLTIRYIESVPANRMFFQTDRIQAVMHVAVMLGGEHNFEKGPVLVIDRSIETIALRLGLLFFVLVLLLYFGRQSGMIYDFGYRAIASFLVLLTGCLSIGGLL